MDTPTRLGTIKKPVLTQVVQSRHPLHQTTIMKFVSLALALLLAVGSNAASLQADAPSQLDHLRAGADTFLLQVKDGAKKALDGLDGTEYSDLKAVIAGRLDDMYNHYKNARDTVSPMTDGFLSTLSEATLDIRTSIMNDIDALKADLEPKHAQLKEVLEKHFNDYRDLMKPVLDEHYAKHTAEMEDLKKKMEPKIEELRQKVATNVEETKAVLMPMVESVRSKVQERLENLKEIATPYVDEYKDQLKAAYNQAQSMDSNRLSDLKSKIQPLVEEIQQKFRAMFAVIGETFTAQ